MKINNYSVYTVSKITQMKLFNVSGLLNTAFNNFDAKKSVRFSREFAVTELAVSGTQRTRFNRIALLSLLFLIFSQRIFSPLIVSLCGEPGQIT